MAKSSISHNAFSKFGASCGILTLVFLLAGFPSAGFIPPLSPSLAADEVVAHYASHRAAIKATGTLMSLIGVTYSLFVATISGQLSRIPGIPRAVIYTQLLGGCITGLYMTLPGYILLVTAYRPERSPDITVAFNDMFWILLILDIPAFAVQELAFSYAVIQDRRPRPLFPRWVAYSTAISTIVYWPALGVPFVYNGALCWNGVVGFWLPTIVAVFSICNISIHLFKAVCRSDLPADGETGVEVVERNIYSRDWGVYKTSQTESCCLCRYYLRPCLSR